MIKNDTSCFRISDAGICPNCKSKSIIKNGFAKNQKQQYVCKSCGKRSIDFYCYNSYQVKDETIIKFIKEGLGIRSTARILQISTTTLLKRIVAIARRISNPIITSDKTYEVDEMRSFITRKDNLVWIVYALERKTKRVVSFSIGKRTKRTLKNVIDLLLLSRPKAIYTDGLRQYKSIIDSKIHKVKRFGTNRIERNNLSLRTHLKRLNRKTICFSRSFSILLCILKIYFWS
ncbi:IS1 family transposase [Flavobacterium sp. 102]|uniref:IS1 family transposase n=1 Tax=Flavobacterium sp. 102 TaxID=2135623 RepID=UPI000EAB7DE8|nr:IS1 family transposase [Flavobacterium sp. 102]RKS00589.1 IS1 family transposase [Flavobacterium sp. 102]